MSLSLLDLLIVAGFVLAAYFGYTSGAARKVFTLLALLVAVLAAAWLMRPAGRLIASTGIAAGSTALVAAFLVLLALFVLLFLFLLRTLDSRKTFRRTGQVVGLLLGLVEGCLVMSIAFWGLRAFDEPGEKLRSSSHLYGPVLGSVPALFGVMKPFLPGAGEFRDLIGQTCIPPDAGTHTGGYGLSVRYDAPADDQGNAAMGHTAGGNVLRGRSTGEATRRAIARAHQAAVTGPVRAVTTRHLVAKEHFPV